MTRDFITTLYGVAEISVARGRSLKETHAAIRESMDPKFGSFAIYEHCLPFNASRAFDEAGDALLGSTSSTSVPVLSFEKLPQEESVNDETCSGYQRKE